MSGYYIENKEGRDSLLEHEIKAVLREKGFSIPDGFYADRGSSLSEIIEKASLLTYPLVAKVSSVRRASKTDVGGIRLGIKDSEDLKKAVSELINIEGSEGVLIEEMVPEGLEVIIGGVLDDQFGPIVMFGLGGIFVEIFKDVAFGLAPLDKEGALCLMRQIKAYPLLKGYRGRPHLDIDTLSNLMVSVSEMIASGNIKEIDLNPVILYPKGAVVVDAKMKMV
ncbi:MAG: acetate--CoA ligase family protein [Thermodesulfovibrionales bacterium]